MKINVFESGIDEKTGDTILTLEFDNEAFEKITKLTNELNMTIEEMAVKYLTWVVENPNSLHTIEEWRNETND